MKEYWLQLTVVRPASVLVVDASPSAQPHWQKIKQLVLQLLQSLPREHWPRVYFLGNAHPHNAAEFTLFADRWYAENTGRGSFLGPVFLGLDPATPAVVILGNGPLFDLVDWRGTRWADAAFYGLVGDQPMTGGLYPEASPTVEALQRRMYTSLVGVEVRGPGWMPFFWDNPLYTWEKGMLSARNTDEQSDGPWDVRLGVLGPDLTVPGTSERPLQALAILAGGDTWPLAFQACPLPQQQPWHPLPAEEDHLLRESVRQAGYRCPHCHEMHSAQQVTCPPEPGGAAIYPTLAKLSGTGFVQLEISGWQTRYRHHASQAMRVGSVVVLRRSDHGEIVRFDPAAGAWVSRGERLHGPFRVGEGMYGLVL